MVVPREGTSSRVRARTCRSCTAVRGATTRGSPSSSGASRYIRSARLTEAATRQDIAPTIAQALGLPMPGVTGHALATALRPGAPAPKAAVLLVLDGFRADYL